MNSLVRFVRHAFILSLIGTGGSLMVTAQEDVSTGPAPLVPRVGGSEFLRGLTQDTNAVPSSIRILGASASIEGLTLRVVALDKSGNFVHRDNGKLPFKVESGCKEATSLQSTAINVAEHVWRSSTAPTVGLVCIDHSITSENIAPGIVRTLRNTLPEYSGRDSMGVVLFGNDLFLLSSIAPPSVVSERCNPDSLDKAEGVAAVYTTLMGGLGVLSDHPGASKVLILITASDDVASIMFSSADVVRKASEIGAKIYVIQVGTNLQSFVYKYISSVTGGRLYQLDFSDSEKAANIVREVFYSTKQHYTVQIPLVAGFQTCNEALIRVNLDTADGGAALTDTVVLWQKQQTFRTTRAVVATFEDTTEVGLQSYYPILAALAEDLMSDSTRQVQLIGHVSSDIRGDADARGFERAGYVSDFLHAYGVKRKQIVIRSDGNRKPLYYIQLDGSQRLLNNRVEARYLDESEDPFTVVVEQVASEELAIRAVDTWEQRGYRAYFEPIVVKRSPAYRVKLWGYATDTEANKVASDVKRRYKAAGIVE